MVQYGAISQSELAIWHFVREFGVLGYQRALELSKGTNQDFRALEKDVQIANRNNKNNSKHNRKQIRQRGTTPIHQNTMPTYSNHVISLLESDDDGSVLAVWNEREGSDSNSVVVLEEQHIDVLEDQPMEDQPMLDDDSEATIERPAPFGHANWRKFQDMHPGRPNGMGFLIFGEPQTWSRPTFFTRWANGRFLRNVVDSNKAKKKQIRDLVIQEAKNNYDIDLTQGPYYGDLAVEMELRYYRRLPNTAFVNDRRTNKLKEFWKNYIVGTPDTKRPDLDNMVKLVKDSLVGIMYKDDEQVVKFVATKCHDFEFPYDGKTEVNVRYVDDFAIYGVHRDED